MQKTKESIYNDEYGYIAISIREKMHELNISKRTVLNETGLKNEVFNRYYYSDIKRLDINVLAKICSALKCDISDVVSYKEKRK